MGEARFLVRGLDDREAAEKVEATLFSKVGIHDVRADPETGQLWLSFDDRSVPPPRLKTYLESAGVTVVKRV